MLQGRRGAARAILGSLGGCTAVLPFSGHSTMPSTTAAIDGAQCLVCTSVRRVASGADNSGAPATPLGNRSATGSVPADATAVHIGDVTLPIRVGDHPERVPCVLPVADAFFPLNAETMGLMRWMAQKELLGQDICLIGEPGPSRRWLALLYCRYAQREVQVLSLSRDTTEADIKQRKEIRKGTLAYLDQAAVCAALNGHVLVLEGLERAERNVLPILNNLLENREMNLDNGKMLVHPQRYDQLAATLGEAEVQRLGLLRVSEHFRVIALAVPVPKYAGNPLDPPLRSRFQCLFVPPPSTAALWSTLADSPTAADALLKFKASLVATSEKGSDSDKSLKVEPLGDYEVLELGRQHTQLPGVPLGALLARVYPWRLYCLRSQGLSNAADSKEAKGAHDGTEHIAKLLKKYNLHHDQLPEALWVQRIERGADSTAKVTLQDGSVMSCACGPLGPSKKGLGEGACHFAAPHRQLFAAMLQSHHCSRHMCLVGPPGCGKTVIVREFAAQLGYPVHVQHLYADMSTRDLFQRRSTDADGDTTWEPSAMVQAAKLGHLAVLDGIDNLPPHTLSVLQQLLVDGGATLLDGTLLKPQEDYDALKDRLSLTDEEMAALNVYPVHPNFRIIAIARPPTTKHGKKFWLTSDIACLFDYHVVQTLSGNVMADVILHLVDARQRDQSAMSIRDGSDSRERVTAKQLRDIVSALVHLQSALVTLAATEDSKIPQLSLRQMIRIALYCSYFPAELRSTVASTLLLPMMSPLTADLVLKQCAAAGIDAVSKAFSTSSSTASKVAASIGGFFKREEATPSAAVARTAAVRTESVAGGGVRLSIGSDPTLLIARKYTTDEQSLTPHVSHYYTNQQHTETLAWLAKQFAQGSKILLVGNQGVGKNKIVDHFLSVCGLPRHYIQLHRDTTVASLTINPRVENGAVIWEDSPLVKAVTNGHVLVIDEIDKAPVDVVQVLKGLVEDKEMTLSDGRRISAWDEGVTETDTIDPHNKIIKLHPDFRLIVLANPPGYPFHGNDFYRECGDLFACHVLENPDAKSQEELLLRYAPQVPRRLLQQLIAVFADLRIAVREGTLQYPFSLRELIHVVRHLQAFPQDGVFQALNNVFNFDLEDQHTMDTVRRVLAKHLRTNAGTMKNRCARPIELHKQDGVAEFSLEGGAALSASFIEYASSEPMKLETKRLAPSGNTNASAATDDFTEVRHVVHLPFEENGLNMTPLQLTGLAGGLTAILCTISPINAPTGEQLYLAVYQTPSTDLGKKHALSPGAVSMVRLPLPLSAATTQMAPSLFDSTVTLMDGPTGTIWHVDCLDGTATKNSILPAGSSSLPLTFSQDPQLPGVLAILATGSNTLRMEYYGKLLAITLHSPLLRAAVLSSQLIHVRQQTQGDGFVKLSIFHSAIIAKYFNVIVGAADANGTLAGPVIGLAGGNSGAAPTAQLTAGDATLAMAAPPNSDVAMILTKLKMNSPLPGDGSTTATVGTTTGEGSRTAVEVSILSSPSVKAFGSGAEGQGVVTVSPWDNELKQEVKFDPASGKLLVTNAKDQTARVISVNDYVPGLAAKHPSMVSKPVIGYDSNSGYSTILGPNGQAAVVDTNAARLDAEYNRWTSVMEGKGGGLGSAPSTKNLEMSYTTPSKAPSGTLKHGKETDSPHVGGNTWAGGTGGTDTAGLGGLIGPYRLDKGHKIHQVTPELKKQVPQHIIDEAKHMGKAALEQRLKEIGMSALDNSRYTECYERVRGCVSQLQLMFNGLKAKEGERVWLKHQSDGVWDDAKIVEGITGEKNIYKKRSDASQSSMFQHKKKKRLLFVLDVSASMYRFNHHDQRLNRLVETAVMIMESFIGHEDKISYSIVGHNGDSAHLPLVEFEQPPQNKKERMDIALKMIAYAQFCWSGDNTVAAMRRSIPDVLAEAGDDYFVFVISDANLEQYGISTSDLSRIIRSNDKVHMYCIFIASFGAQATSLQRSLPPGHGFECLETHTLPLILKRIFVAADLLGSS